MLRATQSIIVMESNKIEKDWEYYGAENPYWAVLTEDKYKRESLGADALADFFSSGEQYVEKIWQVIEQNFTKDFKPERGLDFGCGVGRLTVPIAARCQTTVGVDISEKMMEEAERNCSKRNLKNVSFVKSDENLSKVTGEFDFVHSFIVLQHINPKIGEKIARRLIENLKTGGIGALHFTYKNPTSASQKLRFRLYRDFSPFYKLRNLVVGAKQEPLIPMHTYNLNRLMAILHENDCHNCVLKFTNHGYYGVILFFQKKSDQFDLN